MNKLTQRVFGGIAAMVGVTVAQTSWAGHSDHKHRSSGHAHVEYARVVAVDPIIRRVRVSSPVRECWSEQQPVYSTSPTVARSTIVGGLIGAAAGHHLSHHHGGHDAGLIVGGSLIGAAIGNTIGHERAERRGERQPVRYTNVQRCQVTHRENWVEELEGYRVTYLYHGRRYTTRMPYDPGRRVQVNVDVRPAFDRYY